MFGARPAPVDVEGPADLAGGDAPVVQHVDDTGELAAAGEQRAQITARFEVGAREHVGVGEHISVVVAGVVESDSVERGPADHARAAVPAVALKAVMPARHLGVRAANARER
jgi:hypothetical protein